MPLFIRNLKKNSYSLRGIEKPSTLLFAEGHAEAFFLETWLTHGAYDVKDIAVILVGGDTDKLKHAFASFVPEENFSSVTAFGFFYDAEGHPAARTVQVIQKLLQGHGLIPHQSKLSAGAQTVSNKKIGIFVSPNNVSPGWIEDIVATEIASTNLSNCMSEFAASVQKATGNAVHSKTIAQAFLGIRSPGLCGTAHGFNKSHLDVMHPAYDDIRNVIGSLL